MENDNNHILIVGGGTAGWLSAAILAKTLNSKSVDGVKVTLVESPDIPILGVGEGTWPNLRATFQKVGISETDFIRECDATFKQGAEFINWCESSERDRVHRYYHPLSTVSHSSYDFSLAPYWLLRSEESGMPYDTSVASQARLCNEGVAPKMIVTPEYIGVQEYAYHLDANKLASFLKRHCINKLGVNFISANVINVVLDDSDSIKHVETDHQEQNKIEADFFVDCTGAKGIFIKEVYKSEWQSTDDIIFNDTALAIQVPYKDQNQAIKTHTLATAQEAGWIWDIGLQHRRGVGHVYSSKYISDDKAKSQLIDYVGDDYSEELQIRKISLKLGYHKKIWNKNSVAIGMSAGFVEPLEASAIFLLDAAANMFATQFPRSKKNMQYAEEKFNRYMVMRMQRTVEFIKLHYCISNRRDSLYWKDNCESKSIPENLRKRLEFWREQPPTKYDFENAWEPFNLDSYLYVLYGMNFETDLKTISAKYKESSRADALFRNVSKSSQQLMNKLPKQRELIEKVVKFGFSKV